MEGTVTTHVTRSTTTEAIEPDLAALWRDVAHQGPVARAVMSNLVVFRKPDAAHHAGPDDPVAAGPALEAVVAIHPSRLIVLEHQRDPSAMRAPFAVTVGVLTFGPEGSRFGVELIAIQSACAEACLPSIVRQLVRGDVPTSVWWMDDLSRMPPLDAIIAMSRQFVYDSRGWRDVARGMSAAASLLRPGRRLDLADLNWRRLAPVRQALLHACTVADLDDLRRGHVRVVHRPGDGALAWLCVGWLAKRLGWSRDLMPSVEEDRRDDALLMIDVGDAPARLTAVLDSHQAVVDSGGRAPVLTVPVPLESDANAVAAELRNLSQDTCLHGAIEAAALFLQ
jgi:glucose-6-phosphate dehydrogenase assembly protein OpcA